MKILSIDPSKNHAGFATFATSQRKTPKLQKTNGKIDINWEFGTFHLEGRNLAQRTYDLYEHVRDSLGTIDHLVIEYPAFFSSERGQIAAHQNYTIDLAFICGYLAGLLALDHRHVNLITAITWKGNVTKEITKRKFFYHFKKLGVHKLDEHAIDAAMLLRYFLVTYGPGTFQVAGEVFPECPELQF